MPVQQSFMVFDIETVPDLEAARRLLHIDAVDTSEAALKMEQHFLQLTGGRSGFYKPLFHRVVTIAAVTGRIETEDGLEFYRPKALFTLGSGADDEAALLGEFNRTLEEYSPRLVSFNGRGFDLPVLNYRALKHGLSLAGLHRAGDKWENYKQRYAARWHCDLLEQLRDYGATDFVKLSEVCGFLGIPVKLGLEGAKVAEAYAQGRLEEIGEYCMLDCVATFLLFARLMVVQGLTDTVRHEESLRLLRDLVERKAKPGNQFSAFLEEWTN